MAAEAERLAFDLRRRGRVDEGVSMRVLAVRLGVGVVERRVEGFAGFAVRSVRKVILSPSDYQPRNEFTIAHELAELHIPASWRDRLPAEMKEKACNRVAAALLLPRGGFLYHLENSGWSLPEMRRRFPLASYEAIASRVPDLKANTAASCFVNDRRAWWRGPRSGSDVSVAIKAEREALRGADALGHGKAQVGGVISRAWRLTAKGKRVAMTVTTQA